MTDAKELWRSRAHGESIARVGIVVCRQRWAAKVGLEVWRISFDSCAKMRIRLIDTSV